MKKSAQYQVSYEGQIITEPMSLRDAQQIAADENLDEFRRGHYPIAEVVLAPEA